MPIVDIDRIEEEWLHLSTLVSSSHPGWSRIGFSDEDRAAREWIRNLMAEAGLIAEIDSIGNVIGYLEGTSPSSPDIVIGSHSDTVPGGGRFDGIVGVLGAIEVARMLRREGRALKHGLRVVDFANEEGNPQGVKLVGSRAITGDLGRAALASTGPRGVTLAELIQRGGYDPAQAHRATWRLSDIACYIELHIEQGSLLEQAGAAIGIVSDICGISTFSVNVNGRRDHAGTMPMTLRQDAMCCAADAVLAISSIGATGALTTGTVGEVKTPSPLTNTISEAASLTGEFRSPLLPELHTMNRELEEALGQLDAKHRTNSSITWTHLEPPTPTDPRLSELALRASTELGHETIRVYSGATHDSVSLAKAVPTTMIFIPSKDGRSHCPEEWSDFSAIANGIEVLHRTVIAIDEAP